MDLTPAASQTGEVDFPELLADAMERLQIKDEEALGELLGYGQSAISKWMRRIQTPWKKNWQRIANSLGLSIEAVSVAIGNTVIVKEPSISAQLRQCREEVDRLQKENEILRSRLGGAK